MPTETQIRRRRVGLLAALAVVVVGLAVGLLLALGHGEHAPDQAEAPSRAEQVAGQDRGQQPGSGERREQALRGSLDVPKLARPAPADQAGGPEAQVKLRQGSWQDSAQREPQGAGEFRRVASPKEAEAIHELMKRSE